MNAWMSESACASPVNETPVAWEAREAGREACSSAVNEAAEEDRSEFLSASSWNHLSNFLCISIRWRSIECFKCSTSGLIFFSSKTASEQLFFSLHQKLVKKNLDNSSDWFRFRVVYHLLFVQAHYQSARLLLALQFVLVYASARLLIDSQPPCSREFYCL